MHRFVKVPQRLQKELTNLCMHLEDGYILSGDPHMSIFNCRITPPRTIYIKHIFENTSSNRSHTHNPPLFPSSLPLPVRSQSTESPIHPFRSARIGTLLPRARSISSRLVRYLVSAIQRHVVLYIISNYTQKISP